MSVYLIYNAHGDVLLVTCSEENAKNTVEENKELLYKKSTKIVRNVWNEVN